MDENVKLALSQIASKAYESFNDGSISQCIAYEYSYNSVAIECDIDSRLCLKKDLITNQWIIFTTSREAYYRELGK